MGVCGEMNEYTTEQLMAEIASRDGVQWMKAYKGQPLELNAPEDEYLLVIPLDAMPHKETAKEKAEKIKLEFMDMLLGRYREGDKEAGSVLAGLLRG